MRLNRQPASIALKECTTRRFVVGGDIYSFTWYIMQHKRIFRQLGLLETEVPSSYQIQQCFMTMLFCGISQIMIAYVILIEIEKPILYDVDWYVTFVRFICLSAIHFGSANDFRLQLNTIKFLSFH